MTERRVPGLREACRELAAGRAVVVPSPSPQTYGIVATDAATVNSLKCRPVEQNVAISVHDPERWQEVCGILDLDRPALRRADALLRMRLGLLVPIRPTSSRQAWIEPAVRNGLLAMFNGWWEPVAAVWDGFPRLYGSSANRTGRAPAASAAEAVEMFGDDAVVVDADAWRDLTVVHSASTMIEMAPDGGLRLHRHGAHDAATGLDAEGYGRFLGGIAIE